MSKDKRRLEYGYVRNHFYSAMSSLTSFAITALAVGKHINLEIAQNPVGLDLATTENIVFGAAAIATGYLAKKFSDRAETCMLYIRSDSLRQTYGMPRFMRPRHA